MYACSCSLAAVSLITADANEMLTAYGDRESSRTLHQSTIYLRGGREGGARAGGVKSVGIFLGPLRSHPTLFSPLGLTSASGRARWDALGGKGVSSCNRPSPARGSRLVGASNLGTSWVATVLISSIFGRSP